MGRSEPYGADHQRERAQLNDDMEANGPRTCDVCNQPVYPDSRANLNPDSRHFHLDHSTPVTWGGAGTKRARHATCNESQGGKLGALRRRFREGARLSRDW
jgi:hypothetical protein